MPSTMSGARARSNYAERLTEHVRETAGPDKGAKI